MKNSTICDIGSSTQCILELSSVLFIFWHYIFVSLQHDCITSKSNTSVSLQHVWMWRQLWLQMNHPLSNMPLSARFHCQPYIVNMIAIVFPTSGHHEDVKKRISYGQVDLKGWSLSLWLSEIVTIFLKFTNWNLKNLSEKCRMWPGIFWFVRHNTLWMEQIRLW